ncbi:hypothetical protein LEMLEM_LOCUS5970 [Lemmus lemmus]
MNDFLHIMDLSAASTHCIIGRYLMMQHVAKCTMLALHAPASPGERGEQHF